MNWLTLLMAVLSNPAVQAAVQQFFLWLWARLEKRFGPVPAGDTVAFRERLDLIVPEIPWYRPFMKRQMRKVVGAMHVRAQTGNWRPITAEELV